MEAKQGYRVEHDCIGECLIPENAYYGIHTQRATENFNITRKTTNPEMIKSVAEIKKACAITNFEAGVLSEKKKDAIVFACDEIIWGRYLDQFIVDPIQGGAGTSHNMNANEVIANIAIEHLGGKLGDYSIVHPNDDVNMGQSTNDVYPTSGKIALIRLLGDTIESLKELESALLQKSEEFDDVIKMGRTQMQDAIPIRLGQEFKAYATVIARNIKLFKTACTVLKTVNMGATAIGTGLNADVSYMDKIVKNLAQVTDMELVQAEDLIDGTQNIDVFVHVSGLVKSCAISMSKIANDLRLMSSGPTCGFAEINLPARQAGSSIMPGKVNPTQIEALTMVCARVLGNDTTISFCASQGNFELNVYMPIIIHSFVESVNLLSDAMESFVKNCVRGIKVNKEVVNKYLNESLMLVTSLNPYIGYDKASQCAKYAFKENTTLKEAVLHFGYLTESEFDEIVDPKKMV